MHLFLFTSKPPSGYICEIKSADEILKILRICLPDIREKNGEGSMGIFGSWARGE